MVMNLTCGANGLFPCPICYVPKDEQSDLGKTHAPCYAEESQKSYQDAMTKLKTNGKAILKLKGICPVEVMLALL